VEECVDAVAAVIFATAATFAIAKLAPQLGLAVAAVAIAALAGCWAALKRVPDRKRLPLPSFELVHFTADPEEEEAGELLLTKEQIVGQLTDVQAAEELLLDDILDALGPDSRVVRLFAPGELPTAGQLKASIDQHLRARRSPTEIPDASQALSDALAELRRSLR
jgi:hypothetical protein